MERTLPLQTRKMEKIQLKPPRKVPPPKLYYLPTLRPKAPTIQQIP
ncbi:hypothetical protein [Staphylococcus epidermidis]